MKNSGQRVNHNLKHHEIKSIEDYTKQTQVNQTFKELSIKFYTSRMAQILKAYKRGNLVGALLLLVYYFQIMSLFFEDKVLDRLSKQDKEQLLVLNKGAEWLRSCRIYSIWEITIGEDNGNKEQNIYTQIQIVFCSFAICYNFFIMSYIIIQYIFWITSQNYQPICNKDQNNHEQNVINIIKKNFSLNHKSLMRKFFQSDSSLNKLISFLLQTYRYVITIPFTVVSLNLIYSDEFNFSSYLPLEIKYFLGILLFLSTTSLNFLIVINEFDYSIRYRDCFGSRVNYFRWISYFFDLMHSFLSSQKSIIDTDMYIILHVVSSAIRIGFLVYEFPFFFELAQYCHFYGTFLYFFTSVSGPISIAIFRQSYYYIIVILILPFSINMSYITLKWRESLYNHFISEENIKNISAFHLEYYIRKSIIPLCQLDIESYLSSAKGGLGIRFETIYSEHIINCLSGQDKNNNETSPLLKQKQKILKHECFCQKFQQAELNINNMNGHQLRKQFIIEYVYNLFQLFFTNSQGVSQSSYRENSPQKLKYLKQIKPVYIYYLIQIASTPAKSYTEVLAIKDKNKYMTIQEQFMLELILQDLDYEFISFFEQSNYQNQRLRIGDVYQFDQVYRDAYRLLNKGLHAKQEFFQFLNQDQITLKNLIKKSQVTLSSTQIIEDSLISLFRMNPLHPRTLQIATTFIYYFDFKKRSLTSFILKAAALNESEFPSLIRNESAKMDLKINLFHSKSAAFFICLASKCIIRVSDSSSKLFGCSTSEMIRKPLQLLFPDCYYPHLFSYIEKLIEEANIDLIKIGLYNTFIRTSKESVLPVVMRMKLDFLDESTFGLSCYMQKIETDKYYIICDSNFIFQDASTAIKQLLFKHLSSKLKKKNPLGNFILILIETS